MALECVKCKNKPNIQINVLNYCNECFLNNIKVKCNKILNGMPHNTPILVYNNACPAGMVLWDILSQFFATRKYYTIITCSTMEFKPYQDFSFAQKDILLGDLEDSGCDSKCLTEETLQNCSSCRMGLPHALLRYAKDNNIETIIHGRGLETTLTTTLDFICKGSGINAVASVCTDTIAGIRILNPFSVIRDKEIMYYLYICKLQRPTISIEQQSKAKGILRKFLYKTDSKNSLALFNMLSVVKRLG